MHSFDFRATSYSSFIDGTLRATKHRVIPRFALPKEVPDLMTSGCLPMRKKGGEVPGVSKLQSQRIGAAKLFRLRSSGRILPLSWRQCKGSQRRRFTQEFCRHKIESDVCHWIGIFLHAEKNKKIYVLHICTYIYTKRHTCI